MPCINFKSPENLKEKLKTPRYVLIYKFHIYM